VILLGTGCTGHTSAAPIPEPSQTTSTTSTTVAQVAEAACQRRLPPSSLGFPEFAGESDSSATLYGLLFTPYPLRAGHEAKIVWRMTGSGHIRFTAIGPSGQQIAPEAGPTPHTGSNWRRPGDEWGTFFQFPTRGCWTIRVTRGAAEATAGLLVS
jgi:hypothetical protein